MEKWKYVGEEPRREGRHGLLHKGDIIELSFDEGQYLRKFPDPCLKQCRTRKPRRRNSENNPPVLPIITESCDLFDIPWGEHDLLRRLRKKTPASINRIISAVEEAGIATGIQTSTLSRSEKIERLVDLVGEAGWRNLSREDLADLRQEFLAAQVKDAKEESEDDEDSEELEVIDDYPEAPEETDAKEEAAKLVS